MYDLHMSTTQYLNNNLIVLYCFQPYPSTTRLTSAMVKDIQAVSGAVAVGCDAFVTHQTCSCVTLSKDGCLFTGC